MNGFHAQKQSLRDSWIGKRSTANTLTCLSVPHVRLRDDTQDVVWPARYCMWRNSAGMQLYVW